MKCQELWVVAALSLASAGAWAMGAEERIATQCAACHGAQGQATSPIFPSLAGQNQA